MNGASDQAWARIYPKNHKMAECLVLSKNNDFGRKTQFLRRLLIETGKGHAIGRDVTPDDLGEMAKRSIEDPYDPNIRLEATTGTFYPIVYPDKREDIPEEEVVELIISGRLDGDEWAGLVNKALGCEAKTPEDSVWTEVNLCGGFSRFEATAWVRTSPDNPEKAECLLLKELWYGDENDTTTGDKWEKLGYYLVDLDEARLSEIGPTDATEQVAEYVYKLAGMPGGDLEATEGLEGRDSTGDIGKMLLEAFGPPLSSRGEDPEM